MNYIEGSLSLTDTEIERLGDSLNEHQKQRLSKFVKNKLNKTEILILLSKLSEGQAREALKDLKFVLDEKTVDKEQKFFREAL